MHGDEFMSGGPMDKHFESKHTMMEACSALDKSLVLLSRKIVWHVHPGQETL